MNLIKHVLLLLYYMLIQYLGYIASIWVEKSQYFSALIVSADDHLMALFKVTTSAGPL